jgi:RecA-family ATPase
MGCSRDVGQIGTGRCTPHKSTASARSTASPSQEHQGRIDLGLNEKKAAATRAGDAAAKGDPNMSHRSTQVPDSEWLLKERLADLGRHVVSSTLNGKSAADIVHELWADVDDLRRTVSAEQPRDRFTFAELLKAHPRLNPPIVNGLFREGETVNLIANSKAGKSWLAYNLALSVITGRSWLGRFESAPGSVLLIDNELHRATLAHRIPVVADAMAIPREQYEHDLEIWTLRGHLRSLIDLDFDNIEPGTHKLIILDAKYRFAAQGKSENDNAAEAHFYNIIDSIAERTKAAIVLIHHAAKGSQSEKRVSDVGAGAGAQSRAADCHLILREHEEPGVVVLDAAVRSFAPVEPLSLRWSFPLWMPDENINPVKLKGLRTKNEERQSDKDPRGR